jgi:hypothetical protein
MFWGLEGGWARVANLYVEDTTGVGLLPSPFHIPLFLFRTTIIHGFVLRARNSCCHLHKLFVVNVSSGQDGGRQLVCLSRQTRGRASRSCLVASGWPLGPGQHNLGQRRKEPCVGLPENGGLAGLKAQGNTAWGNAPGTGASPIRCRPKVCGKPCMSLGQRFPQTSGLPPVGAIHLGRRCSLPQALLLRPSGAAETP